MDSAEKPRSAAGSDGSTLRTVEPNANVLSRSA